MPELNEWLVLEPRKCCDEESWGGEGWGYWIGIRSSGWNFPVSGIKSSQLGNCIHDSCMNY